MSSEPNWKPRRRGPIYCSPACGAGCKHKDFLECQRRAASLVLGLNGGALSGPWKPRVWENMGWFWGAVCGESNVHPECNAAGHVRSYTFFFNDVRPQVVTTSADACGAVAEGVRGARRNAVAALKACEVLG